MIAYAHTATDAQGNPILNKSKWQLLSDHLRNVAANAGQFARPLELQAEAEMAGYFHDLGKYADRFQQRLCNPTIRNIDHWSAGAKYAFDFESMAALFAIHGHHKGLSNLSDLRQMLLWWKDINRIQEKTNCTETLDVLCQRYVADGLPLPVLNPFIDRDFFAYALRTRFLFSCLVDADYLDTEHHFNPWQASARSKIELNAPLALTILLQHISSLSQKFVDSPIHQLRNRLLEDCQQAAEKDASLFTLTAPTGSGKTLSSLVFALRHIQKQNALLAEDDPKRLRRIIVVIPYTSIIEQTAQVYRQIFEPYFGSDYVLEHHSSFAPRKDELDQDAEDARFRRARLSIENWSSPLIITTNVQFFESLFAHKPSACRKLHNICRSVILFDEVQTLPSRLVPSLLSAIKLLTKEPYGSSAVFMTATQPAFSACANALQPQGWEPTEIASNPQALAETLKRTQILLSKENEEISWLELSQKMTTHPQALCVVNTTKHALELFKRVRELQPESVCHLSSRMCPAHRKEKLKAVRKKLLNKQPVHLISTQLIEAGVDVDFPIAFRAFGPLDSIIQTAGRCNREGRHSTPCPVIVFNPQEGGSPPGTYKVATQITREFLQRNSDARFHDPELYSAYFRELYGLIGRQSAQKDPVFKASNELDFPKASEKCSLVGDNTHPVLVQWGRGSELIAKLTQQHHLLRAECREAHLYSVNLYEAEFQKALASGHIYQATQKWDFYVWNSHYDEELGAFHLTNEEFLC